MKQIQTASILVAVLCMTACGARTPSLVQPIGETHTNPSSTGGGRPRGHDEPGAPVHIVVGDEVRRACSLPEKPAVPPEFDVEEAALRALGADDPLPAIATCVASGALGRAKLTLTGHSDPRGDGDYNDRLGLYRAAAAKQHLVGLGAPDTRMSVDSAGATLAKGNDETSWALDRKIEVHLSTEHRPLTRSDLHGGRRGKR